MFQSGWSAVLEHPLIILLGIDINGQTTLPEGQIPDTSIFTYNFDNGHRPQSELVRSF